MLFDKWLENYDIPEKRTYKGKSLPETGYKERLVKIYRATHNSVTYFKNMDYITRSLRFAKEHADHMAAVEEEICHVISAYVPANQVYEAYNPGEYFYDGPQIQGRVIYISKPD